MGLYYFHVRDDLGLVEDPDGIELPDMASLLAEVIRSADELSREAITFRSVRFEITDASGRTVLVAPVQKITDAWDLLTELSVTQLPMQ